MNKRDLKKLTKAQLIRLLLNQQAQKPSNSVKQMVNDYEDIIQPPEQFRTSQFQLFRPKLESPYLNHTRVSNKWLKSMKT